jgi:N-acetylglucosaminyl-diphospho-decaprenol L-rhamnosyltransferase
MFMGGELEERDGRVLNCAVLESNTAPVTLQGVEAPRLPDVTAIIVSWNVRELLEQCIAALLSPEVAEDLMIETIVVDNASHDGSAEWARNQPNVQLIALESNSGYGRANNIGLKMARGKHLLILNPDTVPLTSSLSRLVRFQSENLSAGIVAPRLLNADGSVQRSAFRFPSLLMHALDLYPPPRWLPGRLRERLAGSRLNGRYLEELEARAPFRIDHPLGACLMLSREAYERVGGFDEDIFMYSEEIDLALRYRQAGWECWQVPGARVVHLGGRSTAQQPDRMRIELWRSRLYLYRKHYSTFTRWVLSALLLSRQAIDLVRTLVLAALRRGTRTERRAELRRLRALSRLALGR